MYPQVADKVMDRFLNESLAEFDVAPAQSYYYWDVWHKAGNFEWKRKEQTRAALFTNVGANNKHVEIWNSWSKSLGLSGGWLYITRSVWNGSAWVRNRCDMRDMATMKFYPCKS